jgi:hypothetical protein
LSSAPIEPTSAPSSYSSLTDSMMSGDLQILQDSFDTLFTSTLLFDQQSLAELVAALAQLTVGVLEGAGIPKKDIKGVSSKQNSASSGLNESEILQAVNTFAITRLVETALVNISRIEMIWKVLVSFTLIKLFRWLTSIF